MRRRAEQSLQAAIKTLRKSLSRQHFSVQVAGTEYELAQRPAKALEGPGTCGPGHTPQDSRCGESLPTAPPAVCLCPSSPGHSPRGRQTRWEGMGDKEAPQGEALRVMAVLDSTPPAGAGRVGRMSKVSKAPAEGHGGCGTSVSG